MADSAARIDDVLLRTVGASGLFPVYQPIVRLADMALVAHEGLIRAEPDPIALHPHVLLDLARRAGRRAEFELRAADEVIRGFPFGTEAGKLLVNMSAQCLVDEDGAMERVLGMCRAAAPGQIVVELSERDVVADVGPLLAATGPLRAAGVGVALDDFGHGHSSFEMWYELRPEYVKIDRFLVHGLRESAGRLAIVRSLVDVAQALGTDLIAEGIEHADDLRLLRDIGIRYGQGFFIGRPDRAARQLPIATSVRPSTDEAVPLHPRIASNPAARTLRVGQLLIEAQPLTPNATSDDVSRVFDRHPGLHAIPVVKDDYPVGLINRRNFMEQFARPFVRELRARESCMRFVSPSPVICEADQPIDSMVDVLRGEDQRYLTDGFIIVRNGRYAGIGTGEALVRSVTELRIEAARYANPLTLLPGNIPITAHIERLLASKRPFAAAYFDLNNFKPFNDAFGYFRGDEVIKQLADVLTAHAAAGLDFVGHVGGDDFVVLFQSEDWRERSVAAYRTFNAEVRTFFPEGERATGQFDSEDRSGRAVQYPLTTVAVGIACIRDCTGLQAVDVANLAATAKRDAKRRADGIAVIEQRPLA